MFFTSAHADDDTGKSAEGQYEKAENAKTKSGKKGGTIWIEEKISPTTNWIENLAKPLTVWMEQQINGGEPTDNPEAVRPEGIQSHKAPNTAHSTQAELEHKLDENLLISAEQVERIAKEHIAGDVLYIKLIPKTQQYRVKLISKLGEIHIIYIQAMSGDIVMPESKRLESATTEAVTDQSDNANERP